MEAALNGDLRTAQALLSRGAVDVNAKDASGRYTALTVAASRGHAAIVEALLAHGADVNADGGAALGELVIRGNLQLVQALLDRGADPNGKSMSTFILARAVYWRHEEIVRALLAKGADPNARRSDGQPVLAESVGTGQQGVVRLLLDKGADVNARDSEGRTPLFAAVGSGQTVLARTLLDRGANVDAKDKRGGTAMALAIEQGDEAVALVLIERGAAAGASAVPGMSTLELADQKGLARLVHALLAKETAEAVRQKRKEAASLIYFQQKENSCDLRNWNPVSRAGKVLGTVPQCPDRVFVAGTDALVVLTGGMLQEILIKPAVIFKSPIPLLSKKTVASAGHLADGRLAAVFEVIGPADDSTLSLYAFENKQWNLVVEKNCGRFFDVGECLKTSWTVRRWNDWESERRIWHPRLALNPFVKSRGLAAGEGDSFRFPLEKGSNTDEKTWGYLTFLINDHKSVLFHYSKIDGHDAHPNSTAIYLQTSKDRLPVAVEEEKGEPYNTAIEQQYLLLNTYRRGVRLVDLETGKEPLQGLRFAFWAR